MSEKDKANPRQRITMEERWEKAREMCAAGICQPSYRFHVQGCERRDNKKVTIPPGPVANKVEEFLTHPETGIRMESPQKVKVTNLDTGVTSEATIVGSVREVLDQHEKQAVRLKPEPEDFPQEYWTPFEKGQRENLFEPRIIPVPRPEDVRALTPNEKAIRDILLANLEREMLPTPARPWWKFWGRRG